MLINSGHIISEKKFDDADKKEKIQIKNVKENKSYKFAKTFIQNVKIFIK